MSITRSKLVKSVALFVLSILVVACAYITYLWATYIDEITDAGEVYGLVIGETKSQTFERLPVAFERIGVQEQKVFIEIQADAAMAESLGIAQGRRVMARPKLNAAGFVDLSGDDQWAFYFEQNYQDLLRLDFCDGALCRVYRHRKHFELP